MYGIVSRLPITLIDGISDSVFQEADRLKSLSGCHLRIQSH